MRRESLGQLNGPERDRTADPLVANCGGMTTHPELTPQTQRNPHPIDSFPDLSTPQYLTETGPQLGAA